MRKHLKQEEYDKIKYMVSDLNLKVSDVVSITKRSKSCITNIKASSSLEDYHETNRKRQLLSYAQRGLDGKGQPLNQVEEPVDSPEPAPAPDNLERIAVALERLADAWESQPKKKGIFS